MDILGSDGRDDNIQTTYENIVQTITQWKKPVPVNQTWMDNLTKDLA